MISKETNAVFSVFKSDLSFCPISIVSCLLPNSGVYGYGDSLRINSAKLKAYAEALEREAWKKSGKLTTNGFAAGLSKAFAQIGARNEVIERQLLLAAWSRMDGMTVFNPRLSLVGKILAAWLAIHEFEITFYRIERIGGGCGVYARARDLKQGGCYFDGVYTDRIDHVNIVKLLSSLIRMVVIYHAEAPLSLESMSDKGSPKEHALFFKGVNVSEAFEWVNRAKRIEFKVLEPDVLVGKSAIDSRWSIAQANLEGGIELSWGKQSIIGKNPIPHPIS